MLGIGQSLNLASISAFQLSTGSGNFAISDLSVSPDPAHTGWLSRACFPVTS